MQRIAVSPFVGIYRQSVARYDQESAKATDSVELASEHGQSLTKMSTFYCRSWQEWARPTCSNDFTRGLLSLVALVLYGSVKLCVSQGRRCLQHTYERCNHSFHPGGHRTIQRGRRTMNLTRMYSDWCFASDCNTRLRIYHLGAIAARNHRSAETPISY